MFELAGSSSKWLAAQLNTVEQNGFLFDTFDEICRYFPWRSWRVEFLAKPEPERNPCEDQVCGWGKECVVDKYGEPMCECISKCPSVDEDDPTVKVCSGFFTFEFKLPTWK